MSADTKFLDACVDEVASTRRLSRTEAERALLDDGALKDRTISLVAVDHGHSDEEGRLLYNRQLVERVTTRLDEWEADRLDRERRQAATAPPEREDARYSDIFDDHEQLDGVIRALSAEMSLGYVESLTWLQDRYDSWSDHRTRDECETVTLGQVLAGSTVTLDRVTTRVLDQGQQRETELVMLAQDVKTAKPEGEIVQLGGENRVKFAPGVDPDEVLADPVAPRRAWRAVEQYKNPDDPGSGVYSGLWSSFADFEPEWRLYAEAGFDLAASVQLWRHEAEVAQAKAAADHAREQQEKAEKANKTRELEEAARTLSEQAAEARAKATVGRHGIGELATLSPHDRLRLTGGL